MLYNHIIETSPDNYINVFTFYRLDFEDTIAVKRSSKVSIVAAAIFAIAAVSLAIALAVVVTSYDRQANTQSESGKAGKWQPH